MIILGAGGFSKEILTILSWNKYNNDIRFFDDVTESLPDKLFGRFHVIRDIRSLEEHFQKVSASFVIGIGGAASRKTIAEKGMRAGGKMCTIISNHALLGDFGVSIDDGACIASGVTITVEVIVGRGTLVNKKATLSHNVKIGDFCEISPAANLLGHVTIGDLTEIGTAATILPKVQVGSGCKIGAGAIVTKNVHDNQTVAGIPARPIQVR